jgi:hypothetical protein
MERTRRQLLELGGATLATAALAGCIGGEIGTDTDGSNDSEDRTPTDAADPTATATDTATPTEAPTPTETPTATPAPALTGDRPATDLSGYTEWLPAPSTIEFVDETGYAFLGIAPAQLVELGDALGDGATGGLTRETPNPGLETLADATVVLQFARSATLYETTFDRGAVETEFEELGFTAADTHRGFTIFTPGTDAAGSATRANAVGDGVVVNVGQFSSEEEVDKRPAVEAILDAKSGNAERYTDAVPECARLVEALGNGHVVAGRTHETGATFDGAVAGGTSNHVAREESRVRASIVFDGEADASGLAGWAGDADTFHGQEPTTRADGSVATAAALVPSGDIGTFPSEFPGPPIPDDSGRGVPQVNFEFEYETSGDGQGILTVTHYGGDTVPADELFVRGSGFADVSDADQTAAGQWQGTTGGDDGGVVSGDFVDVGVTADYELQIVWEATDGSSAATLAETDGPDA